MTNPDLPDNTADDGGDEAPARAPLYPNAAAWVDGWFRDAMAGHFDSSFHWCSLWWKHLPVTVRLDALWQAWEAARANNKDGAAMSAWWVYHADAHWRSITGPNGPLHQCTPDKHTDTRGLPGTPPPPGWFDTP